MQSSTSGAGSGGSNVDKTVETTTEDFDSKELDVTAIQEKPNEFLTDLLSTSRTTEQVTPSTAKGAGEVTAGMSTGDAGKQSTTVSQELNGKNESSSIGVGGMSSTEDLKISTEDPASKTTSTTQRPRKPTTEMGWFESFVCATIKNCPRSGAEVPIRPAVPLQTTTQSMQTAARTTEGTPTVEEDLQQTSEDYDFEAVENEMVITVIGDQQIVTKVYDRKAKSEPFD